MIVPFTKFTTRKSLILTSKIDQLFSGIGITLKKAKKTTLLMGFK